jgi:hypothetical protein
MLKTASQEVTSSFLDKTQLIKLKLKAMRSGAWFKALLRIDRALVDLTIKVAINIRSATLFRSLNKIKTKLEDFLESKIDCAVREIGFPMACKLSRIAQAWGNKSARPWAKDLKFAQYLAVTCLNGIQFSPNFEKELICKREKSR